MGYRRERGLEEGNDEFYLEMMNWLVPLEHPGRDHLKAVSECLGGWVGGSIKKLTTHIRREIEY